MTPYQSTRNSLIFLIVFNVLAFAVYILAYVYLQKQIIHSVSLSEQLALEQSKKDRYVEVESTIKQIESRAAKLDQYALTENNIINFLKLIETIAREQQVIIKTEIKQNEVKEDDKSTKIFEFSYDITGSWNSVYNFISMVENAPYAIVMNMVSLRKNTPSGSLGAWSATIRFSVQSS